MKLKLLISLLFAAGGFSSMAQSESKKEVTRIKTELTSFDRIKIDAQINVLLYESTAEHNATIESSDKSAETINLKVIDGELIVTADKARKDLKKKLVLHIPVNNLKGIKLNSDAMVVSVSVLNSPKIDVTVNSECWMKLRVNGILNVVENAGLGYGTVTYNDSVIEHRFGDN